MIKIIGFGPLLPKMAKPSFTKKLIINVIQARIAQYVANQLSTGEVLGLNLADFRQKFEYYEDTLSA